MKNALLSIALAATIVLTGCAGFFQSQTGGSGSGTGGSTTSGFFYVLNNVNSGTDQLVGYQITTGKLTTLTSGSANLSGVTCLTISPNDDYLYVGTTSGIYYFTISSAGVLTAGNSGAVISQLVPQSMQVDSTNSWLVIAPQATAVLEAIPLTPTTGTNPGGYSGGTVESVTLSSANPLQLVISPDNNHVFVALGAGGTDEVAFTSTATDPFGADANNSVLITNGESMAIAVDPATKFLYVGETLAYSATSTTNTAGLRVFSISSTANTISELTGSPFASGGLAPSAILPDHSGDYVYVANKTVYGQTTGNITGYGITSNATGSTISLGALANSPYAAGTTTYALAEDNSNSFVIALNLGGSPDMDIYTFDTTNPGALDESISTSTGTDPTEAFAVAAAH
jgi:6-phosphogluconolactonase